MENQLSCRENRIREKNCAVPDIVPMNTKDKDTRPTTGPPISDYNSSVYSSLGHPPTESEGFFSLIIIMMGRPIPHLFILIFHNCHSLHLKILLKREIYLERDIKLSLSTNTSAKNGLNQFWNQAAMVK